MTYLHHLMCVKPHSAFEFFHLYMVTQRKMIIAQIDTAPSNKQFLWRMTKTDGGRHNRHHQISEPPSIRLNDTNINFNSITTSSPYRHNKVQSLLLRRTYVLIKGGSCRGTHSVLLGFTRPPQSLVRHSCRCTCTVLYCAVLHCIALCIILQSS